jgi:DDE superfamily endonuclease
MLPCSFLQGKKERYRDFQLSDGTAQRQMPADVLPPGFPVIYRDPPGVDAEIFYAWAMHFFEETAFKRNRRINQPKFVVLLLDGYSGHIRYKTLSLLRENNIVVLALPANTSHRTQVLDYTVFAPFKTESRSLLDGRCMNSASNSELNNIFTRFMNSCPRHASRA